MRSPCQGPLHKMTAPCWLSYLFIIKHGSVHKVPQGKIGECHSVPQGHRYDSIHNSSQGHGHEPGQVPTLVIPNLCRSVEVCVYNETRKFNTITALVKRYILST